MGHTSPSLLLIKVRILVPLRERVCRSELLEGGGLARKPAAQHLVVLPSAVPVVPPVYCLQERQRSRGDGMRCVHRWVDDS